ncbi:hypothetical protein FGB62_5g263 [Gracilaria domingensis]|nr:hypothetical protein FGB62_5g263 [Gracilaria domingensis]
MGDHNSFIPAHPRVPSLAFIDRDSFSTGNISQPLSNDTESPALPPFVQEQYALLEQVLRKDDSNGPSSATAGKIERPSDPISSPLIDEFYFTDIMADAPSTSQNVLQTSLKTPERLYPHETEVPQKHISIAEPSIDLRSLDSAAAATDLSSGLESLCASNEPETTSRGEQQGQQQAKILGVFGVRKNGEHDAEYPVHSEAIRQFRAMFPFNTTPVSRHVLNTGRDTGNEEDGEKNDEESSDGGIFSEEYQDSAELRDLSPSSNISMTCPRIGSHPDLYENLSADMQARIDAMARKIANMPRRKLRESLAEGVTIEDVEPLMIVNRDELAGMLGLGVTTWKMFVHNSLGVPRWPARALKSQTMKEKKLLQSLREAEGRGDHDSIIRIKKEHSRVVQNHLKRRRLFRAEAKQRSERNAIRKKR